MVDRWKDVVLTALDALYCVMNIDTARGDDIYGVAEDLILIWSWIVEEQQISHLTTDTKAVKNY